nr:MBL fold metallo-hydrolase [Bacillus sp. 165]
MYKVKEGIYAAIVTDGSGALGNAGIIDLGDKTLIFDTFQSPLAANDLKEAAAALTGKPVSYVVNSHWHFDHILGNQEFTDAAIISTSKTRECIEQYVPPFIGIVQRNPNYPVLLKTEASTVSDYNKRKELLQNASDAEHLARHINHIEVTLPTMTLEEELYLYGSNRQAVLVHMESCHSESDVVLYLPDDQVLFAGDIVFHQYHPSLKTSNPDEWIRALQVIDEWDIQHIVPGHGDIAAKGALETTAQYIIHIQQTAATWNGEDIVVPNQYKNWDGPSLYYDNLEFVFERERSKA